MLVTRDVFQEQMVSEIGSMLLHLYSCNKYFFPHLMTDCSQ